jgi:guanylate kinase
MDKSIDDEVVRKLATYAPADSTTELIKSTPILLLVGPTGAGKDAIKEKLLKTGRFHHIISHTTRPPRINHGVIEQNGREYHFIDQPTAIKMIDEQALIEAKVYSGNLYGTSVAEIRKAHDEGKIAMTDIEVQGVSEYKSALNELEQLLNTDYYIPVINDELEQTFKKIQVIAIGQNSDEAELNISREVAKKLAKDIQSHLDKS